METKKHRRKIKHTVMLVSNAIDSKAKQHALSAVITWVIAIVLVACVGTAALCFYVDEVSLTSVSQDVSKLENKIAELTEANAELEKVNAELEDRTALLGTSLDEKIQAEEEAARQEAAKYIPNGLPATRAVAMNEVDAQVTEPELNEEELMNEEGETVVSEELASELIDAQSQTPIVIFELQAESVVMATGNGTVIMISEDPEYTTAITVDHGNGYVSNYRANLVPIVAVGDTVEKGTALYETVVEGSTLGYQILLNAEYINPAVVMELKG